MVQLVLAAVAPDLHQDWYSLYDWSAYPQRKESEFDATGLMVLAMSTIPFVRILKWPRCILSVRGSQ
jgi:hypothetical protein